MGLTGFGVVAALALATFHGGTSFCTQGLGTVWRKFGPLIVSLQPAGAQCRLEVSQRGGAVLEARNVDEVSIVAAGDPLNGGRIPELLLATRDQAGYADSVYSLNGKGTRLACLASRYPIVHTEVLTRAEWWTQDGAFDKLGAEPPLVVLRLEPRTRAEGDGWRDIGPRMLLYYEARIAGLRQEPADPHAQLGIALDFWYSGRESLARANLLRAFPGDGAERWRQLAAARESSQVVTTCDPRTP